MLDLLECFHFTGPIRKLRKILKQRLDALDDLRDAHVQKRLLTPLWPEFLEAREFKALLRRCERKLADGVRRELRDAKSAGVNRRLKEIEKLLCRWAGVSDHQSNVDAAIAVSQNVFARVAALRPGARRSNPAGIHRLRVAFKRFRYLSELLQPFLPGATEARLERMREYQSSAGDIQDLAVLLARLDRAIRDGDCESRAVKNLRNELLRRRDRTIDFFMARIDDWRKFRPDAPATAAKSTRRKSS